MTFPVKAGTIKIKIYLLGVDLSWKNCVLLYLESYISRLNEILRHDLTLSVGEPDNAVAKQG